MSFPLTNEELDGLREMLHDFKVRGETATRFMNANNERESEKVARALMAPTEEQWNAYAAATSDHQEDVAHTANVLGDHFSDFVGITGVTCWCGKDFETPSKWAMHVAEVLHQ